MTFTSASTVRYFLDGAGGTPSGRIVSIGPATSRGAARGGPGAGRRGRAAHARRAGRGAPRRRARLMRPVTLLTDYGTADEFAGVLHAVIARIAPDARVIDLGHGIRRQDVLHGAMVLARTLPYAPAGVHVAVVDPGVGGAAPRGRAAHRRGGPAAGRARQRRCSCPRPRASAASAEAVEISASPWRLEPVSATFHGRDLFAPVAARLAAGAPLAGRGDAARPGRARRARAPAPRGRRDGGRDRRRRRRLRQRRPPRPRRATSPRPGLRRGATTCACGRCRPTPPASAAARASARSIECAGLVARYGRTFADVGLGEAVSARRGRGRARSQVALNTGDAAAALCVAAGDRLELARA